MVGVGANTVLVGVWPGIVEALTGDPLLGRLRAVRERHLVQMPTELLVALSQYAADGCWYLAWALHPDRVPGSRP